MTFKEKFASYPDISEPVLNCFANSFRKSEEDNLAEAEGVLTRALKDNRGLEEIQFLGKRKKQLLGYLIILHCVKDQTLWYYLYLDLKEFLVENEEFFFYSLLTEEEYFYKYLYEQEQISTESFFSNICCKENLRNCWKLILFRFQSRLNKTSKPAVSRRRGYHDHGALRDYSSTAYLEEEGKDFSTRDLMLEIEDKRLNRDKELHLLEEHFKEGTELTDDLLLKFRIRRY